MTETPTIPTTFELAHGARMPRLGFGTSPMDDRDSERAVAQAIEVGYRLVDTAESYGNERGVGRGLAASGVPREELFVTTKMDKRWHGVDLAGQALTHSLDRLGLDYVDLFLIHWPNPQQDRYVDAWRGLARLLEDGRVRAIGMSNFKPAHLDRVIEATGVTPDVNQIQLSPLTTREATRAYDEEHGIVTQSWSPIGGGRGAVLDEPVVVDIARRIGRSPAQVVLRWHLQLGLSAIPKSSDPARIRENFHVFDFALNDADMAALSGLDRGESEVVDSDDFGH
jgi:2,5-diketo-D-gluconate reductase A